MSYKVSFGSFSKPVLKLMHSKKARQVGLFGIEGMLNVYFSANVGVYNSDLRALQNDKRHFFLLACCSTHKFYIGDEEAKNKGNKLNDNSSAIVLTYQVHYTLAKRDNRILTIAGFANAECSKRCIALKAIILKASFLPNYLRFMRFPGNAPYLHRLRINLLQLQLTDKCSSNPANCLQLVIIYVLACRLFAEAVRQQAGFICWNDPNVVSMAMAEETLKYFYFNFT
ncbi:hypothetical protein EGR_10547 [Echinococcus granulosus]|uniref:Uncharacterized protein n=1 Tax=Echinococcus granulosus TaxID=6210 RepID=W6U0N7_ECHGR|nr:hypothetical protein EGR_10547 [Echinococcus granulosus]EUB54593.1 hypothetical protein EGR_10547 [Echinococcus granulosus]